MKKNAQLIKSNGKSILPFLVTVLILISCQKNDEGFNDLSDLNNGHVEIVDSMNGEKRPDNLSDQPYETSEARYQKEIRGVIREDKVDPVIVCGIIIHVLEEHDVAELELKFNYRNLQMIEPLYSNTILLFEIDMSPDENRDRILQEIRNADLVITAEWGYNVKKK